MDKMLLLREFILCWPTIVFHVNFPDFSQFGQEIKVFVFLFSRDIEFAMYIIIGKFISFFIGVTSNGKVFPEYSRSYQGTLHDT